MAWCHKCLGPACFATWLRSNIYGICHPLPLQTLILIPRLKYELRVSYIHIQLHILSHRRWIIDSRDEFTAERLAQLDDAYKLYRCKVSGVLLT